MNAIDTLTQGVQQLTEVEEMVILGQFGRFRIYLNATKLILWKVTTDTIQESNSQIHKWKGT